MIASRTMRCLWTTKPLFVEQVAAEHLLGLECFARYLMLPGDVVYFNGLDFDTKEHAREPTGHLAKRRHGDTDGLADTSPRTIHRLKSAGKLAQPVLVGVQPRWVASEIDAWIEAGCPTRHLWEAVKDKCIGKGGEQ